MSDFFPATATPDWDWWGALWPDPEGVLEKLGAPRGQPAVDLCCGDGYFTAPLSRLAKPAKVYALDLDEGLIEHARRHVAERGEGDLAVFVVDEGPQALRGAHGGRQCP